MGPVPVPAIYRYTVTDRFPVDTSSSPVVKLCSILEHAMACEGSSELHAAASKALVEIGAHFPEVKILFESRHGALCAIGYMTAECMKEPSKNDLTQELASQGMSIVYELGDSSMKESLVNALVSTLTGSGKRKRAIKAIILSAITHVTPVHLAIDFAPHIAFCLSACLCFYYPPRSPLSPLPHASLP
ncbi:hypothetical protein BHE74_00054248 [Ensete ventricosum]|nr:hypothetical protein BHE74_00054248 [Ensete ventricosum]